MIKNKMTHLMLALLTLVLVVDPSHGAPAPPTPQIKDETPASQDPSRSPEDYDTTMRPAPPLADLKAKEKEYYYPYLQSLSPRLGVFFDTETLKDDGVSYLLGFNYLVPRRRVPQWEVGANIASNSEGHLTAGLRWILMPRESFRPFCKAGVLHRVQADQKLGSVLDLENFMAFGALGIEDFLKAPMSVRIELELAAGFDGVLAFLVFGYSWAW